jgi:hypothetical protein
MSRAHLPGTKFIYTGAFFAALLAKRGTEPTGPKPVACKI